LAWALFCSCFLCKDATLAQYYKTSNKKAQFLKIQCMYSIEHVNSAEANMNMSPNVWFVLLLAAVTESSKYQFIKKVCYPSENQTIILKYFQPYRFTGDTCRASSCGIVALVPARGGSKGVQNKNLAKIRNETLL